MQLGDQCNWFLSIEPLDLQLTMLRGEVRPKAKFHTPFGHRIDAYETWRLGCSPCLATVGGCTTMQTLPTCPTIVLYKVVPGYCKHTGATWCCKVARKHYANQQPDLGFRNRIKQRAYDNRCKHQGRVIELYEGSVEAVKQLKLQSAVKNAVSMASSSGQASIT